MSRPHPYYANQPQRRTIRVLAAGTLFLTHSLALQSHPSPSTTVRAQTYVKSRNGSATNILAMLAQLKSVGVDGCWLVASLGGNDEGSSIVRELEKAGVSTRYSKVWDGFGVPAAWVLHAGE